MTRNHLGGAHVWTLDMDDFSGYFCSDGAYPLINHLRTSMGKYSQLCSLEQLVDLESKRCFQPLNIPYCSSV